MRFEDIFYAMTDKVYWLLRDLGVLHTTWVTYEKHDGGMHVKWSQSIDNDSLTQFTNE